MSIIPVLPQYVRDNCREGKCASPSRRNATSPVQGQE